MWVIEGANILEKLSNVDACSVVETRSLLAHLENENRREVESEKSYTSDTAEYQRSVALNSFLSSSSSDIMRRLNQAIDSVTLSKYIG